jgi:hypothetical protein
MSELTMTNITEPVKEGFVGGFTLDVTIFILGSIIMAMFGYMLFLYLFGQPMRVAKDAQQGGSIIQHFDTPKSAAIKLAKVSGGGFQYKDIRDGTVSATPGSVLNLGGRQLTFTFAQLGVTIPPKLLTGVSILISYGVNSLQELKETFYTKYQPVIEVSDDATQPSQTIEDGVPYYQLDDDKVILTGYNFMDFRELLKQSTEEKLIPLTIEAVPNFVEKNINADITEKKLTIKKEQYNDENPDNTGAQLMQIAIIIALLILVQTVIK